MNTPAREAPLSEIFKVFFKLGILGFGGPLAHVAMMRKEVVERRKWLSEQEFMDLLGATHLIPGPNSTELAIHVGHTMGGIRGLFVAGVSFITPAFLCVLGFAVTYVNYGSLPAFEPILAGIRPVIIAIVIEALVKFRRSAIPKVQTAILALIALILIFLNVNEILLILGLAGIYALLYQRSSKILSLAPIALLPSVVSGITSGSIFYFFLKIGSVLFGSGYVLLAFLQTELVDERMWLTQKQLLDAVTVGQFTPGPVFTTATFIGFLLKSYEGAILATLGIFIPSFFFVALSAPFLKYLRSSTFFGKFIDGVNAVSFALLAKVTFDLTRSSFVNPVSVLIGIISISLILKYKNLNSAWLILCGGACGYFYFT